MDYSIDSLDLLDVVLYTWLLKMTLRLRVQLFLLHCYTYFS